MAGTTVGATDVLKLSEVLILKIMRMSMLRKLLVMFAAVVGLAMPIEAQDRKKITAEMVERSLNSAYDFFAASQKNDGSWSGYEGQATGQTALVVLALLNAGREPDDPVVAKSLNYLRSNKPAHVYEASLQTMVYCAAEPEQDLPLIRSNVQWLLDAQVKRGNGVGGWAYDQFSNRPDQSNSQFAALALWEAQRVGIKIPTDALRGIAAYWRARQKQDPGNPGDRLAQNSGGWGYNDGGASGSMTAAGIASLLMAEDAANIADVVAQDDQLVCCGGQDNRVRDAQYGLEWLARNFSISQNPGGGYLFYYLYGIERVGRLTGQRLIGGHDWYREGSAEIVSRQSTFQGFFNDPTSGDAVTSTALGVLFLSKGKRQIVIARAQLPEDDVPQLTNQFSFTFHDHAVNHLNGHIEKAWKRDLSWQSIALTEASVIDLMESPVLFISGSERLLLDDRTKAVIKEYVENGGFIFAEARNGNGCNGEEFEKSFAALMAELFESEMHKLSTTHPVWSAQIPIDVKNLPKDFWLYGVEACCRTAVVYSPISLACRWELNRPYGLPPKVSAKVLAELDEATAVGINVVTYATGRELKERLEVPQVALEQSQGIDVDRGTLRLPRLRHAGGDDETPRAIPRLLTAFEASVPTQIDTTAPLITPTSDDLKKCVVVYIHGRNAFEYSDADREALRQYFQNGGVLLGDSICANESFSTSLKAELAQILPDAGWEQVSANDRMLTNQFQGFDIRSVTMLDPSTAGGPVAIAKREGPPVLERLIYNGRTVCIFSPYDLSCALESSGVTQCRGYVREDAARIGINMILAAMSE